MQTTERVTEDDMNVPQVGEFWERKGRGLRIEILRAYAHDEFMRVVFYGEDFLTMAWLEPSVIIERYAPMGTIDEAHAEALEYHALVTESTAPAVLEAEDDAQWNLEHENGPRLTMALEQYQETMGDYGVCLVIGCHVRTLTVHVCRDHLIAGA